MGVTFPSGFKLPAATQEPEHRASAVRTGIIKAILIHKEI